MLELRYSQSGLIYVPKKIFQISALNPTTIGVKMIRKNKTKIHKLLSKLVIIKISDKLSTFYDNLSFLIIIWFHATAYSLKL